MIESFLKKDIYSYVRKGLKVLFVQFRFLAI